MRVTLWTGCDGAVGMSRLCQHSAGCMEIIHGGAQYCRVHAHADATQEEKACLHNGVADTSIRRNNRWIPQAKLKSSTNMSKKGGSIRCMKDGCAKFSRGTSGLCIAHGGGKRCAHEGCTKASRGCEGFCIVHGGGKRCSMQGCSKSAVTGNTKQQSEFCITHGGGKRCTFEGCTKVAQGVAMLCIAHGGGRRCKAEGCLKSIQGSTGLCRKHFKEIRMFEDRECTKAVHARNGVDLGTKVINGLPDTGLEQGGGTKALTHNNETNEYPFDALKKTWLEHSTDVHTLLAGWGDTGELMRREWVSQFVHQPQRQWCITSSVDTLDSGMYSNSSEDIWSHVGQRQENASNASPNQHDCGTYARVQALGPKGYAHTRSSGDTDLMRILAGDRWHQTESTNVQTNRDSKPLFIDLQQMQHAMGTQRTDVSTRLIGLGESMSAPRETEDTKKFTSCDRNLQSNTGWVAQMF